MKQSLIPRPCSLISAVLLSVWAGCACALEPREQALADAVAARHAEAVALLRASVEINSGTMNVDGVRQVGELFADEFRAIGFATEWVEGAAFNRSGHLVASGGSRGPRLLLIGHLDTVFPVDGEFQDWTVLDDGRVRAPGISDMKGGNVVMLEALRALQQVGVLQDLQLRVVLTGDEEDRGRPLDLANRALLDAAAWADIAIGFEDGDGDPATAVVSRRGSSNWELTTSGRAAHRRRSSGRTLAMARLSSWRASSTRGGKRCPGRPTSPSTRGC